MTALERLAEATREALRAELLDNSIPVPFSGCLLWLGSYGRNGYGYIDGEPAYQASFRAFNGPLRPGFMVCHHCDVKLCIAPWHLYLGTARDNSRDATARNRNLQAAQRRFALRYGPSKLSCS